MRVAFSVPVRIGCAAVRNRIKRRIRAIIRENSNRIPKGAYLIRVYSQLNELDYKELSTLVVQLMHESSVRSRKFDISNKYK